MRIAWLAGERILPVRYGGQIRTVYTLRELARRHSVTVFNSYVSPEPEPGYEEMLTDEFPGSMAFWRQWRPYARGIRRIPPQLHLRPKIVTSAESREMTAVLSAQLSRSRYDVVVCDFPYVAANLPARIEVPLVLFAHNVEWQSARSMLEMAPNRLMWLERWLQVQRLRRWEMSLARRARHTICVSEADAQTFRKVTGEQHATWIPTGVDLTVYRPIEADPARTPLVLFTGHMDYPPNVDAVRWFCAEIWPTVLEQVPRARFRIVGMSPTVRVRELASDSVEVTGEVETIVEHFVEATVVVAPIRTGGGTRLKIYEAMACGRPLVSTRFAAGGLNVTDGQDIVFADEPGTFAGEVTALLLDPVRATQLGAAAATTASRHGWQHAVAEFEHVLLSVAGENAAF